MSLPFISPQACDVRASFEIFPPKKAQDDEKLWEALARLAPLGPRFVSVTYGAGGTTRDRTFDIVTNVPRKTGASAAAHMTCIGAKREEVDELARRLWAAGVRRIVALRGDVPGMKGRYVPDPGGYAYSSDLVAGLRRIADFDISVAGYPEKHPEAPSMDADMEALKKKVGAGANRVITQFFMEPDLFLRFRDRAAAAGINVPIVPGVMPIANFARNRGFAATCGAAIPRWMEDLFAGLEDNAATHRLVAAAVAADMCRRLYAEGVRDFHFYTLNRADLTYAVCHMLGMRAQKGREENGIINKGEKQDGAIREPGLPPHRREA